VNLGKAALWVVIVLAAVSLYDYFVGFVRSVGLGPERQAS
jgi:hypothetical protein